MGFRDRLKKVFNSEKDENEDFKSQEEYIFDGEKSAGNDEPAPGRNFKYLDGLIHGKASKIVLDSDIVLDVTEESEYLNGIKVDVDGIVIDGNGFSIDGLGKARIFECSGKDIAIRNVTFKNGFSDDCGGAVHISDGTLDITGCIFECNCAASGAALANYNGSLRVKDSTFSKNSAGKYGGAVNNGYGETELADSKFIENSAGYDGGALTNFKGKVLITKSSFSQNASQCYGGAIHNYIGAETTVEGCRLSGNSSKENGGGILNNRFGKATVNGTALDDNSSGCGGAIHNCIDGFLTVHDAEFKDNDSKSSHAGDISNRGILKLEKSRFNRPKTVCNMAHANADESDADQIHESENRVKRSFRYLNRLIHENEGGEVKLYYDIEYDAVDDEKKDCGVYLSDINYSRGIILEGDLTVDGMGHAVNARSRTRIFECSGENVTIRNITLKNGHYEDKGGALYNFGDLKIIDCVIEGSTSDKGGAVFNNGNISITDSRFISNKSDGEGASIYNYRGNLKVFRCEVSECKSPKSVIFNGDSLQIHNSRFNANRSGHVILNEGKESNLGIFSGKFNRNIADESVICNCGKFCSMEKPLFEENVSAVSVINRSEMTLIDPKINDGGRTILNEDYLLVKNASSDFKKRIEGSGTVEFENTMIPKKESFDFGYLDRMIHESDEFEIILDDDISLENYERDFYEGGIELDIDGLVIDGRGRTIDGGGKTRIFMITAQNITLKNIIFKNGFSHRNYDNPFNNDGGALKINHCNGIVLENCRFTNNVSEKNGGAIYNHGGQLDISKSELLENRAGCGGALYMDSEAGMTIDGCSLSSNTAELGNGGAICINGKCFLNIAGTLFESNSVGGTYDCSGGAIYSGGAIINISDSTLSSNMAYCGGAIYNKGEMTISKSALEANVSDNFQRGGGAIYNFGDLKILDSTLTGNTSKKWGGAIDNRRNLIIEDSSFSENAAKEHDGGAIYNVYGTMNVKNSIFNSNISNKGKGGAIYNDSDAYIFKSDFNDNIADAGRGASILNDGNAILQDTCINSADSADIINNRKKLFIKGKMTSNQAKPVANSESAFIVSESLEERIDNSGKIITLKQLDETKKDFTYLNELIESGNDEIILENDILLNVFNDEEEKFKNGIPIVTDGLVIDGAGHTIDAQCLARIFECRAKNVTIKNITLKNGYARKNGGAICNDGELTIIDSYFTKNSTDRVGGAICSLEGTAVGVSSCTFVKNSARGGGAIYLSRCESFDMEYSILEENIAGNGGAILNYGKCKSRVAVSKFIKNNSSKNNGGAIYNSSGIWEIEGSTFDENTSNQNGGAIQNNEGKMTIANSTLSRSSAAKAGGAIYNEDGRLIVGNTAFGENTAGQNGGAIKNKGGMMSIEDSAFNENSAGRNGGAINSDNSKYAINNCTFVNNHPDDAY